ncbi:MAG TPA: hypothetical protein IAA98_06540 [Candidatus Avipropionibacterium avicola]|uniref:Histone acetyltransferase Rv0428c-like SH3 domain-containing protein n=1 Tax=Candidatus Avipropionibacterium avicola TaxID=2840701 RepID=A0A9D1GYC2_9ACTN|nr:hypothetical protein [Candidatus Avipropionibacterium avicola]
MVVRRGRALTTLDLGERVVVRHRLDDGRATDILGELVELSATELVVRDRHDVVHRVVLGSVVAAKVVPPAPPRRRS